MRRLCGFCLQLTQDLVARPSRVAEEVRLTYSFCYDVGEPMAEKHGRRFESHLLVDAFSGPASIESVTKLPAQRRVFLILWVVKRLTRGGFDCNQDATRPQHPAQLLHSRVYSAKDAEELLADDQIGKSCWKRKVIGAGSRER